MINRILKKHVILSMKNGQILEGFITVANGKYFELIEADNNLVLVNQEAIAFVRVNNLDDLAKDCCSDGCGCEEIHPDKYTRTKEWCERTTARPRPRPDLAAAVSKGRKEEYSMEMPNPDDIYNQNYSAPTFTRTTKGDK